MLSIVPCYPNNNDNNNNKNINNNTNEKGGIITLNGYSTINSLPLSNSGDDSNTNTELVSSALSFVAQLLVSLSVIFNVKLPHQIYVFEFEDCCISPGGNKELIIPLTPRLSIVRNNNDNQDTDIWNDDGPINEKYPLALSLLRANVIELCLSLEIPKLWPPQAVLLNLHELHLHCIQKANSTNDIINNITELPPLPILPE